MCAAVSQIPQPGYFSCAGLGLGHTAAVWPGSRKVLAAGPFHLPWPKGDPRKPPLPVVASADGGKTEERRSSRSCSGRRAWPSGTSCPDAHVCLFSTAQFHLPPELWPPCSPSRPSEHLMLQPLDPCEGCGGVQLEPSSTGRAGWGAQPGKS